MLSIDRLAGSVIALLGRDTTRTAGWFDFRHELTRNSDWAWRRWRWGDTLGPITMRERATCPRGQFALAIHASPSSRGLFLARLLRRRRGLTRQPNCVFEPTDFHASHSFIRCDKRRVVAGSAALKKTALQEHDRPPPHRCAQWHSIREALEHTSAHNWSLPWCSSEAPVSQQSGQIGPIHFS